MRAGAGVDELVGRWLEAWPQALAAWGRPTRMHAPVLHTTPQGEASFAWFSTTDVEVAIDLAQVRDLGLADHAVAVLAHEVGHHVLAPGDLLTSARIAARVRLGLVDADEMVGTVANLWNDLLVNDRLQRRAGVDMVGVWRALGRVDGQDPVMQLVLRADEILWELPPGTLAEPPAPGIADAALLAARLVRAYARDPVGGAGGFATLLRTSLPDEVFQRPEAAVLLRVVTCGQHEGASGVPAGLATDPSLTAPVLHPAVDPRVVGDVPDTGDGPAAAPPGAVTADASGQTLQPGDVRAVLGALGVVADERAVAAAWYREHARAHLVPFPHVPTPAAAEDLLGGLDRWQVGDDVGEVDWLGTVTASPVVVPGMTTVRREHHADEAADPASRPVDLDLYLDSSGSMPDPAARRAPIALAGAILALSALRSGARVQATTWSGPGQVAGTDGFTRDPDRVLAAIVAHFGAGTAFPVAVLERTFLGDPATGAPPTTTRPTHVAVISDDGITTILPSGTDRRRGSWAGSPAARAVAAAGGGATFVLELPGGRAGSMRDLFPGVDVHAVSTDEDLVAFARAFARRRWHEEVRRD